VVSGEETVLGNDNKPASSTIFLPIAWTPASNAATVPDPCGRVAALSVSSAYNWSKVFTSAEVWMAAEYEGKARTAEEISQLLYHLQVMMVAADISLEDVYAHL
jgi:phosphoribosyl-ATP pyrophosphohydrolase